MSIINNGNLARTHSIRHMEEIGNPHASKWIPLVRGYAHGVAFLIERDRGGVVDLDYDMVRGRINEREFCGCSDRCRDESVGWVREDG